ncbi:unnamed protein product [Sphagnum jensenii]|uniref:Uncharacterized protein n=2 Tax=Sphagnum jensenii TaxID=128206 RepID=A0ABP0VTR5_9BRYO
MARRHHEGEGGGGAWRRIHLVVLLLICVTCGAVYLVCSPVLRNPFEKEVSSSSSEKNKKTMVVGSLDDKESCCHGAEGTELWGEAVNWGPHLILNSSYQCCTACKANSKCNSWVFCGDRDKCAAKYGECWLKVQEDLLAPQVQDTGPHVAWTSGLIYREGTGVIELETERGVVHIQLMPDCAPRSVAYIIELLRLRHCSDCVLYRAEGRAEFWDAQGNHISKTAFGPPYAVLQGILAAQGVPLKDIPMEARLQVKRGMVGWVEGGPDFFISLANHEEWYPRYTIFGSVLEKNMTLIEELASLSTVPSIWSGVKVGVLKKRISFNLRKPS